MRSDIDGLRAIAIVSVILYHAVPEKFHSGIIGVDIFFVISGFLITKIILKSMTESEFTFPGFYKKRILRLFPSLIMMLMLVSVLCFVYFIPSELEHFGKHLRTGSFFTNFSLFSETGYFFSRESQYKPLLHFWSLAVEEQFYFIWPLVLFLTHKKKWFLHAVLILFGLSLGINLYRVHFHPEEIFYLLHGRFWELLSGCLLAWYISTRKKVFSYALRNILSGAGLSLLTFSFFKISQNGFPGWQALLPVVATVLIILGEEDSWINKHFLSLPEMVFVGRISYPLYLWHWPLMVFVRSMRFPEITIWLAIGFSFLLASFSYLLLEVPLKRASVSVRNKMFWGLMTAMLILAGAGQLFYQGTLVPLHIDPEIEKFVRASREEMNVMEGYKDISFQGLEGRVFGEGHEKILLLGDSHLQMHLPYFIEKMDLKRYSFYDFSKAGCTYFYLNSLPEICTKFLSSYLTLAKKPEFSKIVIIYHWTLHLSKDSQYFSDLSFLKNFIQTLAPSKKIYVVEGIPFGKEFDPLYMIRNRTSRSSNIIKPARFDLYKHIKEIKDFNHALKEISESSGARYINTVTTICPQSKCDVIFQGEPAYVDSSHMRRFYVIEKATYLAQIFEGHL